MGGWARRAADAGSSASAVPSREELSKAGRLHSTDRLHGQRYYPDWRLAVLLKRDGNERPCSHEVFGRRLRGYLLGQKNSENQGRCSDKRQRLSGSW
jgi:hypothetical protein